MDRAAIDYHSIRLRLGSIAKNRAAGGDGKGERPKHPRARANCRNAPLAKTVNRRSREIKQMGRSHDISRLVSNSPIAVSQQSERGRKKPPLSADANVQLTSCNQCDCNMWSIQRQEQKEDNVTVMRLFSFNQQYLISKPWEMLMHHILLDTWKL